MSGLKYFGGIKTKDNRRKIIQKQVLFFGSALIVTSAFLFGSFSKAQLEDIESVVVKEVSYEETEKDGTEKNFGNEEEKVLVQENNNNENLGEENDQEKNSVGNPEIVENESKSIEIGAVEEAKGASNSRQNVGEEKIEVVQSPVKTLEDKEKSISKGSAEKEVMKLGDVAINEVAWMGTENSYSDEWIELHNDGAEVDLDDWKLIIKDKKEIKLEGKIKQDGYFLIERTDDNSVFEIEADLVASFGSGLNNSGGVLILENGDGEEVDKIDATGGWPAGDNGEKKTMVRDVNGNWQNSKCSGGTPRAGRDTAGSCKQYPVCGNSILEEGEECDDGSVFSGDGCSAVCLVEEEDEANDDDNGLGLLEGVVINELLPDPQGSDTDGEWVELYNSSDRDVLLKGCYLKDVAKTFYFTDQAIAGLGFLILLYKETKINLNNSGDSVELFAPSGEPLSAVSYEKSPASGYAWSKKEGGNYDWTTTPTPGEKNIIPPKKEYSKKIKFNEVLANPDGIDKNHEWVELRNDDLINVDLKNWAIENGSKKLFVIKDATVVPSGFFVVSIEKSSMSVRNRGEVLRLLNPNGDEVDLVSWEESAKSGSSFNRTLMGLWRWSGFLTPGAKNKLNSLPVVKIKRSKNIYKDVYAQFDASKTKDANKDKLKFRWDFGDGHKSYLEKTRHKYEKNGKYRMTLIVDDGSEKVSKSFKIEVKSFPRRDLIITKLIPNPDGSDRGYEIIGIRNLYGKNINLEGFKIATGSSRSRLVNHPIYEDFIIRPGKDKFIKNDNICKFSLPNKKGVVALRYPDGKIADIVIYEKEKISIDEEYVLTNDHWIWVGGNEEEKKESVQFPEIVARSWTGGDEAFDFLLITKNEKEKICECLEKIMIENWKMRNNIWLKVLEMRKA